tara:strand:- start:62 stop:919 length:858 start_codon:yes stop_codon:yes gene_type:complete
MENLDSLKIAGKTLKKNREKLNISIKEVANELRLEEKIINDIEKGRFEKFNNYVFLKGYLKNYANFLNIKIDFLDIKKEKKLINKSTSKNIKQKNNNKISPKHLITSLSLLVLIGLIFILQPGRSDLELKKQSLFEKKTNQEPFVEEIKKLDNKPKLQDNNINSNSVIKSNDESADDIEILESDANKLPISQNKNSNSSDNTVASNDVLSITYNGDSWTEIIDSYGNIVFFELVKNGTKLRLNIQAPFEILLGNATVVNIKYNNIEAIAQHVNPENNVGKVKIKK